MLVATADCALEQPVRTAYWHCPRREDFQLQRWPDGAVVYDEASGDLHALNPISGELLHWILSAEQSTPESLAEALFGELPVESDVSMLRAVLMEFEFMGFVEPCDL